MTLTKAIEAARDLLIKVKSGGYNGDVTVKNDITFMEWVTLTKTQRIELAEQALAALPDKPMAEVQIFDLIDDATKITLEGETIHEIIRALKAANVLYVEEK